MSLCWHCHVNHKVSYFTIFVCTLTCCVCMYVYAIFHSLPTMSAIVTEKPYHNLTTFIAIFLYSTTTTATTSHRATCTLQKYLQINACQCACPFIAYIAWNFGAFYHKLYIHTHTNPYMLMCTRICESNRKAK